MVGRSSQAVATRISLSLAACGLLLLLILAVLWQADLAQAFERVEARIGAAHFPPYTVRPLQGADSGRLPQRVQALNHSQQRYHFGDLQQGRTDMAVLENPAWGWQDIPHVTVDLGLEAPKFIAARHVILNESFFVSHDHALRCFATPVPSALAQPDRRRG